MDTLLREVGRCGRFQVLFVFTACLPRALFAFFMLFMSFGNYNPGWRCLDNVTDVKTDVSPRSKNFSFTPKNVTFLEPRDENCGLFESCRNVQFNPDASTLVTEWGLTCHRSWIASAINSAQMSGVLVGAYIIGYMADRYGRKVTMLVCMAINCGLTVLSIFSVSWQMFAILSFLSGIFNAAYRFLPTVLATEFVSTRWRAPVASAPYFGLSSVLLAVCAMVAKDWRQIQISLAVLTSACFILMVWLPRSIRWLVTHNKRKEAFKVARTIAKLNKKPIPSEQSINTLITSYENEAENKKFAMLHLFRREIRFYTFFITFVSFTIGLSFYVISFGIKSLPGNIYINLITVYGVGLSSNFIAGIAANVMGRRRAYAAFFLVTTTSLFGVVVVNFTTSGNSNRVGILILAMAARTFAAAGWCVSNTLMSELFPTVIRGSITGWACLIIQIGAIIAPFLIPSGPDKLYISYLIMGSLNLGCIFFFFKLPETAGENLHDTWKAVEENSRKTIPTFSARREVAVIDYRYKNVAQLDQPTPRM